MNYGDGERKLCASGNHENHDVRVTETAAETWTVTNNDPQQGTSACLEKHGGGKIKTKFCGVYDMPFFFTVTPK